MIQTEEVPKVAELSEDFNDLLQKLLHKDPLQRPCWQELKDHSWWSSEIPVYELKKADYPQQPLFSNWALMQRQVSDINEFYK